jgi:hypothetical protein
VSIKSQTTTTTLTGKQTTLTGSTLSGFLNTTNDFVCNVMTTKLDLSKNTINYVERINTELTTVLTGEQATLTRSALSGFLNTTNDFVYNTGTTKIDFPRIQVIMCRELIAN